MPYSIHSARQLIYDHVTLLTTLICDAILDLDLDSCQFFFRISFTLLLARGMLSYRALRGYSWDVIGSGKACSGSACVGEFLT